MRVCPNCGQSIDRSSIFCAMCGTKVPAEAMPTAPQAAIQIQDHVDPLASTSPASMSPARHLGKKKAGAGSAPASPGAPSAETGVQPPSDRSPAAMSAVAPPAGSAKLASHRGKTVPLSAVPKAQVAQYVRTPGPATPPASPRAPVALAPPTSPHVVGARVLVQWSNGQRYPGIVERVNGPQCLVRFDVGEQRWVESRFVLPGR
jgi:hypothetical protein